jgi:hypothetical protein
MKKIFLSIVIGFGLISCRPNVNEDTHIVIPGKGFDKVEIERTTLGDLIEYFGNNFSVDTFYVHPIFTSSCLDPDTTISKDIYSIKIAYDSLGTAFFFKPNKPSIFSILIYSPFKGKTDHGIKLNTSTFKDVETKYGATSWSFSGDNIMKEYNGITFLNKGFDGMMMSESELIKCLDFKVTEISINKIKDKH